MDVDVLYPNLSSFVQSKTRQTLNQCGEKGELTNDYDFLALESSCWAVFTDQPNWRGGPHQTLKTLDEFIKRLPPNTPTRRIRDKICSKGSEFLDTVVEAAWVLRFWTHDIEVYLEQPLEPSKPKGKNADLMVVLDGRKHWLDAISVQLSEREFPIATAADPFAQLRSNKDVSATAIAAKLAEKARTKYQEKFGEAVRSGLFQDEICGILLCVFKSEKFVLPAFHFGRLPPPPAPEGLLDNQRPGLNLVWVHTLHPAENSWILQPIELAMWQAV